MKKKILLMPLLFLCSCSINSRNNDNTTGTTYAKIVDITYELSSKEMDTEFFANDIIEPISANMYTLNINTHYTLCLNFKIGGGSIPPKISVDDLHIVYNEKALNIKRIKYLDYIAFYDLLICDQIEMSAIVFSINDVFSSVILSTC